ncbi:MAG: MFS transporter [Defluviicoccus sp.]|nr:MFS transporter [Defluviicoccus sp.]MDE0382946.1 MFS transporter [Defluviicoccus sp.]
MATLDAAVSRDAKVIALVCVPHMLSHAYFLVLPTLFPLLKAALGLSYTDLGLALSVFGLVAGFGQLPVGFLVDWLGGRRLLIAGMALQGAAVAMIGFVDSYWQILVLMALAGLAHTVYHPADYAILTATVDRGRLGRAYGIHAFTGNLGFAIAPVFMVTVATLWHWRAAYVAIGAIGILVALALFFYRDLLREDGRQKAADEAPAPVGAKAGLRFLMSAPILMCFAFFVLQMAGSGGLRTFTVAALDRLFQTPLAAVNAALFGLVVGSAIGTLAGADYADRVGPRIGTAVMTLGPAALLIVLVGAVPMPLVLLTATLAAVGFALGFLMPSRDLLLQSVTPDGAMGRAMGFASSGANLAGGLVPVLFGWMLDNFDPRMIFWFAAAFVALALLTFSTVKGRYAR